MNPGFGLLFDVFGPAQNPQVFYQVQPLETEIGKAFNLAVIGQTVDNNAVGQTLPAAGFP